jgi:hypothetical protein
VGIFKSFSIHVGCKTGLLLLLVAIYLYPGGLTASDTLEDYFIFLQDNKKGVRNAQDKILIPAEYDDLGWSIGEFDPLGEVLGYQDNGLWGLMTLKNKKISPPEYQNLYPLNRQLMVASVIDNVIDKELFGIIDLEGKVLLEFRYGRLGMFNNLLIASKYVDGHWNFGMMDLSFQEVLPFKYQLIKALNNKFAIIMEDDKYGLVNATGQILAPPTYHQIELHGNSFKGKMFDTYEIRNEQNQLLTSLQVKSLKTAGKGVMVAAGIRSSQLLTPTGEVIATHQNVEILDFSNEWAVFKRDGLFGLVDNTGRELIEPIHPFIWITKEFVGVNQSNGKWQMLDRHLQVVSKRPYQQIKPDSNGFFPVRRQDSWGFINHLGEEVIPPQYQEVSTFKENRAFAQYLGSWGVIDNFGQWIIKPRYDKLHLIDQTTYLFQEGHHYGMVNTDQMELYRTSNKLQATATGVIEADGEGNYSLISIQGVPLLSLNYSSIRAFEENPNYYGFEDEEGLGIFNIAENKFFRDTVIQEIRTLNEGYIGVRINDQYGLIDLNGKLRIANRYEDVGVFNEDMLPVKIRGRWGFVDRLERLKVQPVYDAVDHFINDIAIVSKKGKHGLIDRSGKIILSLEYNKIVKLPQGSFICYQGEEAGLVDIDGHVLLYPSYSSMETLKNGHYKITKNGKLGVISDLGKPLIPTLYDSINYDPINQVYLLTKSYPWDLIKL